MGRETLKAWAAAYPPATAAGTAAAAVGCLAQLKDIKLSLGTCYCRI
jgi:hypothetical protein